VSVMRIAEMMSTLMSAAKPRVSQGRDI
jgi:hypothetical protein